MSGCVTVTGPPRGDLLAEARHHAAGRAEHVAEAHDHELRAAARLQRLAQHLGQALGGAHHVGRVDRLVGRDQDELARRRRACAARATVTVVSTLLATAWNALSSSISGTCL